MADGVWKGVYPQVFGHSKQPSQNKLFDLSTPFMSKVDDGEEKRKEKKKQVDDDGNRSQYYCQHFLPDSALIATSTIGANKLNCVRKLIRLKSNFRGIWFFLQPSYIQIRCFLECFYITSLKILCVLHTRNESTFQKATFIFKQKKCIEFC